MNAYQKRINRWRNDVVYFATDELKIEEIEPWMLELFRVFPDPEKRRIAMKACKGVGKTMGLAVIILNFLACYNDEYNFANGAATSISGDNIDQNLWPEIAKWLNRSEILSRSFEWTKSRVQSRNQPEQWFFAKRTWSHSASQDQQSNTLAGIHGKYVMLVMDESGGIPMGVAEAGDAVLTADELGKFAKVVQAGNPTHLEGPLYMACTTHRHMWHLINITGDPDDPNRCKRQSLTYANEMIEKWGRDNPWVKVNVFSEFPPSSINALLGPDEVEAAMHKRPDPDTYEFAQKRIGVDVARFGDDRTVFFPRQGLMAFLPMVMRNQRTDSIAARLIKSKIKWESEMEFIDDTGGFGGGVIDAMFTGGYTPTAVHMSGSPLDDRYYNKRAEVHFLMAEWIKRGGSLPNMPELVRELTAPTYTFSKGKFLVEEKAQIKSRLGGVSPDLNDALSFTFALPDMPGKMSQILRGETGKMKHDWDPYA